MTTWEDNRKRIAGLWPQYEPTDDEKALFAERLGHRRQDWLEEALKRHRSEDHDGAYKPKLSRIIAHYDDIRQAGDKATSGPTVNERAEQVTAQQVEADAQAVLADMLEWDGNRRRAAVAELQRLGVADLFGPTSYPDDVRKWSRTARGLAHAADERMTESMLLVKLPKRPPTAR